jgi:hypothetical protein
VKKDRPVDDPTRVQTGPDSFQEKVNQKIQQLEGQMESIDEKMNRLQQMKAATMGSLQAYKEVSQSLMDMRDNPHLQDTPLLIQDEDTKEIVEKQVPDLKRKEISEVDKRKSERRCCYKDRKSKKWCRRRLKVKREQSSGYCEIHMSSLGID